MYTQWLLALSPIIGFLFNVITQIICARITKKVQIFVFSGLMSGLLVNSIIINLFYDPMNIPLFVKYSFISILTYFSLSFCYWGFLNLNRTSLRIRILREILDIEENGINKDTLLDIYSPEELIHVRLKRMSDAGKIIKIGNKWKINRPQSSNLLILALFLEILRTIIIPKKLRKGQV